MAPRMLSTRRLGIIVVSFSIILHALALLSFLTSAPTAPREWSTDFLVLLGSSLFLALAILLVRNRLLVAGVFLVRALVYLLLSIPQGPLIGVRFLLLASLLMDMGARLPTRMGAAGCVLVSTLFLFIQRPISAFGVAMQRPAIADSLAALVFSLILAAAVILLRAAVEELASAREKNLRLDSSVLQLTSANTEFLQFASVVERESIRNERNRITRELHDVIGQTLTNIIMMMDAVSHRGGGSAEETAELLKWTREQAQGGLENTRAALYELRAIPDERLKGVRAIKKLVDTFSKLSHAVIKVDWGNMPWELDEVTDLTVYRIVQESLSNSFRHGNATAISIYFFLQQGALNLTIRDNGQGGMDGKKGIGQSGMEERGGQAPRHDRLQERGERLPRVGAHPAREGGKR